jgi:hypothetical protein
LAFIQDFSAVEFLLQLVQVLDIDTRRAPARD